MWSGVNSMSVLPKFHHSSLVPCGFHQGSITVALGSARAPGWSGVAGKGEAPACGVVRGWFDVRFYYGSTRFYEGSTRFPLGDKVL